MTVHPGEVDFYVEPGGFAAGYHTHPFSVEIFTLVRGNLRVHCAGQDIILDQVGQTVSVPAGTVHRWFSNSAEETAFAVVELITRADRFETLILRQLFGSAQDGKTDSEGRPNLLQHAVTMRGSPTSCVSLVVSMAGRFR